MILVDSPVWIDHLHSSITDLQRMLDVNAIVTHPWVVGEIALGSIKNRNQVLRFMNDLPLATVATVSESHALLNTHSLWSRGIGWVDLGLLASAKIDSVTLWTRDKSLLACADHIGVTTRS